MSAPIKPVLWTAAETAAAIGADPAGAWRATGVSIDSRTLVSGDLFVAIRGPKADGHKFIADAFAKGAVAAVVHVAPAGVPKDAPLLKVDDTMRALEKLGQVARARTTARVIAITGSVGKTGTKEALRLALTEQGATSASEASYNNQWGVPLSLARMPKDSAFGVFEMGMNHAGELTPLSRMARPHVAVITAVEAVHIEFFPSVAAIADAKAEVFAGIEPNGVAVLPRDNPHFERLVSAARARGVTTVLGFGTHREAFSRLLEYTAASEGSTVRATVGRHTLEYRLAIPGRHWAMNSLAVLATMHAVGGDLAQAAAALIRLRAPKGRGQRHPVRIPGGALVLIDESYNASPASMTAAIETLAQSRPAAGGRRIAVLGDMLELGPSAPDRHAALAEVLMANGIDLVFTAGTHMTRLWDALPKPMRGGHAVSSEKLAPIVAAAVRASDVVMVKGSLGSRMALIVQALLALDAGGSTPARPQAVNGDRG
jgi:UDP-N-acetylmuramoyl-tripeptide--D-alanyl-D-alanine ligase